MDNATVCMPWRPQLDRIAAYDRCVRFWRENGFDVVEGDSDPEQLFSRCQARNNAARKADTEVLIFADADTLPDDISQVAEAIDAVGPNGNFDLAWPFTYYRPIPEDWVHKSDLSTQPVHDEIEGSTGGIIVVRSDAFWRIGGWDERFVPGVWGFEDAAFAFAAVTLLRTTRLDGAVWSFDHPDSVRRNLGDDNPNKARWQQYVDATFHPEAMRELIGLAPAPN